MPVNSSESSRTMTRSPGRNITGPHYPHFGFAGATSSSSGMPASAAEQKAQLPGPPVAAMSHRNVGAGRVSCSVGFGGPLLLVRLAVPHVREQFGVRDVHPVPVREAGG